MEKKNQYLMACVHFYTHTHTHTLSRALWVPCSSLRQRVLAVWMLHSSLFSLTACPSNTAFHWWLKASAHVWWIIHIHLCWITNLSVDLLQCLWYWQQSEGRHQPPTGTFFRHSEVTDIKKEKGPMKGNSLREIMQQILVIWAKQGQHVPLNITSPYQNIILHDLLQ